MKLLSDWLDIMLEEIARKREDAARAEAERQARAREAVAATSASPSRTPQQEPVND